MTYGFSSAEEHLTKISGEHTLKEVHSGTSALATNEKPISVNKDIPLVGPIEKQFSVQQVKKADGSHIYLINKGRNITIDDSKINRAESTQDGS